jgi:AmmeMemoRadiSam system protein B
VIRRTAVAGSWYSNNPTQLAAELDAYLNNAASESRSVSADDARGASGVPRALICPHAGLMYSGPVAAFAYTRLNRLSYRAIVLVGPSHFIPFRGVSIWPAGQWQTPFGPVDVDVSLADAIRTASPDAVDMPAAHGREHSLEMQLPFIAHLLPGVPIVPLVMGQQTREAAFGLGDAIAAACQVRDEGSAASRNLTHSGPASVRQVLSDTEQSSVGQVPSHTEQSSVGQVPSHTERSSVGQVPIEREAIESGPADVLLIASSDLSHYENAAVAARMDAVMVRHIETLDPEGLMTALEDEPRHACGGGPMVAVLHAARQLGGREARVLRYADSGDVSGDKSSVVGYLAAAVF